MNRTHTFHDDQLVQRVDLALARYRRREITPAQKQAEIDGAFLAYREGLTHEAEGSLHPTGKLGGQSPAQRQESVEDEDRASGCGPLAAG